VAVLPARRDFAVGGFFSDIYGTMRLPHQQEEENEQRVNSPAPGAPEPSLCLSCTCPVPVLCLSKEPAVAIRAASTHSVIPTGGKAAVGAMRGTQKNGFSTQY
jgi:hypothetical protein